MSDRYTPERFVGGEKGVRLPNIDSFPRRITVWLCLIALFKQQCVAWYVPSE